MAPDYLIVGHIVKDIIDGGWRPGGSIVYAAKTGLGFGQRVAAVTRCAEDLQPETIVPGVEWLTLPGTVTTTFENRYIDRRREQRVPQIAEKIGAADIPPAWRTAPLVLLTPVIGEIESEVSELFPASSHVGLGAQGWLRRLNGSRVEPGEIEADAAWARGDTVFVSEEDITEPETAAEWRHRIGTVIVTRGGGGCTVWDDDGRHDLAAFAVDEENPTGAGDVFAAAYMIAYQERGDRLQAARIAAAAAALSVRGAGLEAVPDRGEVEEFLRQQGAAVR